MSLLERTDTPAAMGRRRFVLLMKCALQMSRSSRGTGRAAAKRLVPLLADAILLRRARPDTIITHAQTALRDIVRQMKSAMLRFSTRANGVFNPTCCVMSMMHRVCVCVCSACFSGQAC